MRTGRLRRIGAVSLLAGAWGISISPARAAALTLEARVAAQEKLTLVAYSHQIGSSRSFESAVPQSAIEGQVRTALKESLALERLWHRPITSQMLRRETERMFRETKMPDRLLEIAHALGDDPILFQECVARPVLVRRLLRGYFARDERVHGEARREIEELGRMLASGELDPRADHPRRSLQQTAPGASHDGAVVETEEGFEVSIDLDRNTASPRTARYSVPKRTWDDWWTAVSSGFDETTAESVLAGQDSSFFPALLAGAASAATASCPPDHTWDTSGFDAAPVSRSRHTAVWTGNVMIVWGGNDGYLSLNTGGRYDPALDVWAPTSTAGAPSPRLDHTAVWTGSRMIVWGGVYYDVFSNFFLNTGGQYDPLTDSWTLTSLQNAPGAATAHAAVWTGTEMVVWGGRTNSGLLSAGRAYTPGSDHWRTISPVGAPPIVDQTRAVWTGSRVIVFGIASGGQEIGGRYDPASDTWAGMTSIGAPTGNYGFTVIWTGTRMIVWGGTASSHPTSARYDPVTDTWSPVSGVGAPVTRSDHTAVWTGTEMIIWGGAAPLRNDGGRYNPSTDSWQSMSAVNAPLARSDHEAVWTGNIMVVWGSVSSNSGGRYDPVSDSWTPTSTGRGPSPRAYHTSIWSGGEMIVWGGSNPSLLGTGGRFDPVTAAWTPTSLTNSPAPRNGHSAVWTGTRMIIWGGSVAGSSSGTNTGAEYDPVLDVWLPLPLTNAPTARYSHAAVWTGTKMIVWGGSGSTNSGGRYDPGTATWTATSTAGAPIARTTPAAVWTGSKMVVWGGGYTATGGRYDPVTDVWSPVSTVNAPPSMGAPSGVWTGSRMLVWGVPTTPGAAGFSYDPLANTWPPISLQGSPLPTGYHAAVWTGSAMIVWGGQISYYTINSGGVYDTSTNSWTPTSISGAPMGRTTHTALWTGTQMIVWGGLFITSNATYYTPAPYLNDGGAYNLGALADADGDGLSACAGDCNDSDPGALHSPAEVAGLELLPDRTSLLWSPASAWSGTATRYDLLRGVLPALAVGTGSGEACIQSGGPVASGIDPSLPPAGSGFWYLVRSRNACGAGTYGSTSAGTPRTSPTCP